MGISSGKKQVNQPCALRGIHTGKKQLTLAAQTLFQRCGFGAGVNGFHNAKRREQCRCAGFKLFAHGDNGL